MNKEVPTSKSRKTLAEQMEADLGEEGKGWANQTPSAPKLKSSTLQELLDLYYEAGFGSRPNKSNTVK